MRKPVNVLSFGIGILGLTVAFLVAGHATPALATDECRIVGNPTGRSNDRTLAMPANSSSAALRAAYQNGSCRYLAGLHESGTPCGTNPSLTHITVQAGGITYHVFQHMVGDDRFCTTGRDGEMVVD